MHYVTTLIAIALLSATTIKAQGISNHASEIRSQLSEFAATMHKGWKLDVSLKNGQRLAGALGKIDQADFELTIGKKLDRIAYATVDSVSAVYCPKCKPPGKDTLLRRAGRGLQTSFAAAAIGTVFVATYPSTKLTERSADAKAEALKKEIAAALPPGSNAVQVIAFLDSRKIVHASLQTAKSHFSYPNERNIRLISASLPQSNRFSFFEYQIDSVFRFDEADRLIDYKVSVTAGGL